MTTEAGDERPDEQDVAWRLVTDLFNRPTWPTDMWNGTPADAARQLDEFGEHVIDLAEPVHDHAPYLIERAVQLASSAKVCGSFLGQDDAERVRTADRAQALCDALAPFAAVADRVLNDLVDHYGFRNVLTPRPTLPPGHEGYAHHPLHDGVRALVYWSDNNHQSRQTDSTISR